jgi:hypothetical protein
MAYMGNLVKGDRVKVTIEADVTFGSSFGVDLKVGDGIVALRDTTWSGLEFEKVEPPVETFKPGDVVRSKAIPEYLYLLCTEGVVYLPEGEHYPEQPNTVFTSKGFEKVDLSD